MSVAGLCRVCLLLAVASMALAFTTPDQRKSRPFGASRQRILPCSHSNKTWVYSNSAKLALFILHAVAKLIEFRDTMKTVSPTWASALESWTCPTNASNSDSDCDPCGRDWWGNWDHMACRSTKTNYRHDTVPGDGIITHLHFSLTGVDGPPFHSICPIGAHLKEWDFKACHLNGTLPTWASSCLPAMEEYDLSRNYLYGEIPVDVANMTKMNQFKMQGNKLTGALPAELGSLPLLEWLRVFDNELSGSIPSDYAALAPRLTQVAIGGNQFTGNLYPFAETQLLNVNVTHLPKMCGMVPVGMAFASGFDLAGSPGLMLPCPDEVANGWPEPKFDF